MEMKTIFGNYLRKSFLLKCKMSEVKNNVLKICVK